MATQGESDPPATPSALQSTIGEAEQSEPIVGKFGIRHRPRKASGNPNELNLIGSGEIEFSSDGIRLSGRVNEFFGLGPRKDLTFQRRQVLDVLQIGKMVQFDIVTGESAVQPVQFLAKDERSAQAIAQFLPDTVTELHAQQFAQAKDFEKRLQSVGGRALVTPVLVGVNVAVFAAAALAGAGIVAPNVAVLTRLGTNYGPLTTDGQWWRLLTSTFLHFGIFHLALNMWALYVGGRLVERLYGSAAFLLLYIAAGLCGSLCSLLWNPAVNSAGASGAVFGVYGAMLAFFLRKDLLIPAVVMRPQRNSAIVFIVYNLANGLSHQGIDNAAHVGGLLGGLLLGLVLARPMSVESRLGSRSAYYTRGLLAAAAILGALAAAVSYPANGRPQEQAFRRDLLWFGDEEARAYETLKDMTAKSKQGEITQAQYAERLEREVIPQWERMQQRISSNQLPRDSKLNPLAQAYQQYVGNRLSAYRLLDSGLRENRPEDLARGRQLIKDGDKNVAQIRELRRNN